jgi:hypothetical protein
MKKRQRQEAGITQRMENFALAFVETSNASEAYRRAYPKSKKWKQESVARNANRLREDPRVQKLIAELREQARARTNVTIDGVLADLQEMVNVAMGRASSTKTIVTGEGDVVEVSVKDFNGAVAAKGLQMLGEYAGVWDKDKENDPLSVIRDLVKLIQPTRGLPRDNATR